MRRRPARRGPAQSNPDPSRSRLSARRLLLAAGEHPRVVMEILGHSQFSLTMNTYSHVMPAALEGAAGRMDALLGDVSED